MSIKFEETLYKGILCQLQAPHETSASAPATPDEVLQSWSEGIRFKESSKNNLIGFRPPQIAAIFSLISKWKSGVQEATIVLPTGTGKTEVMLATYAHERANKLLVIVPTKSLREQLAQKFLTMGLLPKIGALPEGFLLPNVYKFSSSIKDKLKLQDMVSRTNVIIATPHILRRDNISDTLAEYITHVFVDEAHHSAATNWSKILDKFKKKGANIGCFTATPFRRDKKSLLGEIAYVYPLGQAQKDGYFQKINFISIVEVDSDKADEKIARQCIEQLKTDLAYPCDHVAMARANSKDDAEKIHDIYCRLAPEYNPVLIHSGIKLSEYKERVSQLQTKKTRIVVCVDMFGEGFDFPNFKIAAMHATHKSLAITLQFIGRFTRTSGSNIGNATAIANVIGKDGIDIIQELYKENADWNHLIQLASGTATSSTVAVQQFASGFNDYDASYFPPSSIQPPMSATAYKVPNVKWKPEFVETLWTGQNTLVGDTRLNVKERVAYWVVKKTAPIKWTSSPNVTDIDYDVYTAFHDMDHELLFVHSQDKNMIDKIADKCFDGHDIERISGENVFKAYHDLTAPRQLNIGTINSGVKNVRFTMRVGSDIKDEHLQVENQNKVMSNTFVKGYRSGNSVTLGASRKGKFWAYQTASSLLTWRQWCQELGLKLTTSVRFTSQDLIRSVILPKEISTLPNGHKFISAEWPAKILSSSQINDKILFKTPQGTLKKRVIDIDLSVKNSSSSHITIQLHPGEDKYAVLYEYRLTKGGTYIRKTTGVSVYVKIRSDEVLLDEYLKDNHLEFTSHKGALLSGVELIPFDYSKGMSFDPDLLKEAVWTGVDLTKESRYKGSVHRPNSIQQKRIDDLIATGKFDLIIDDDGAGEIADIVAIGHDATKEVVSVLLSHCKYTNSTPGKRIADLYEVCGQAQRSSHWKTKPDSMLNYLESRIRRSGASGTRKFVVGNMTILKRYLTLLKQYKVSFDIEAVQPGVQKSKITDDQKELLVATKAFLQITTGAPFTLVCSP